MLKVNSINVIYETGQALWDASLSVGKGEVLALIGSNGAGKSTLLKTIMGSVRPASGEITFLGERIDGLPPHKVVRRGISIVPEGRRLFPYMTVLENLRMGAYVPEVRGKRKESLEWVFSVFPALKERQKQLVLTLSGGEQQMLAIGRGLMLMPKLMLLDEPSLGLAPFIVMKLFDVIKEINRKGVTLILVEQNARQAFDIADRACVLETGRIVLEGTKEQLLSNEYVKKAYLGM